MQDTVKVFMSYSHLDNSYIDQNSLFGFLKGFEKDRIPFWTDRQIRPGELWDEVIKTNLNSADIALVLVSQGFLDSDYCQNIEITGCLGEKKHLIPVILSPCDRLGADWKKLADVLEIPPVDQARFERGGEGRGLWVWLQNRNDLSRLIPALSDIGRGDLVAKLEPKP